MGPFTAELGVAGMARPWSCWQAVREAHNSFGSWNWGRRAGGGANRGARTPSPVRADTGSGVIKDSGTGSLGQRGQQSQRGGGVGQGVVLRASIVCAIRCASSRTSRQRAQNIGQPVASAYTRSRAAPSSCPYGSRCLEGLVKQVDASGCWGHVNRVGRGRDGCTHDGGAGAGDQMRQCRRARRRATRTVRVRGLRGPGE